MKTKGSNFRRFGLVGRKISYSFSPAYFNEKFKNEQIHASYKIFDIDQLHEFPSIFLNKDLAGLNITTPYKEEILIFMDSLSPEAKEIGAVNTIRFKGDRLIGHNTDYIGFKKSIQPLLKNHHHQALILGTGGATKAIKFALNQLNIPFQTVSRNKEEANFIYNQLTPEIIKEFPIIINATPLGTFPEVHKTPNLPIEGLGPNHLVYDLIYNPEKTLLLQNAENQGAEIKNGLEMLKIQAEASWDIWNLK